MMMKRKNGYLTKENKMNKFQKLLMDELWNNYTELHDLYGDSSIDEYATKVEDEKTAYDLCEMLKHISDYSIMSAFNNASNEYLKSFAITGTWKALTEIEKTYNLIKLIRISDKEIK